MQDLGAFCTQLLQEPDDNKTYRFAVRRMVWPSAFTSTKALVNSRKALIIVVVVVAEAWRLELTRRSP